MFSWNSKLTFLTFISKSRGGRGSYFFVKEVKIMLNNDEKAKKRREQRHKEMRAGFIKNLNALMNERNYSCQQLSTNIGKNVSYINRILNNKIMPSIEVLVDIADVFGIEESELLKNLHDLWVVDSSQPIDT